MLTSSDLSETQYVNVKSDITSHSLDNFSVRNKIKKIIARVIANCC